MKPHPPTSRSPGVACVQSRPTTPAPAPTAADAGPVPIGAAVPTGGAVERAERGASLVEYALILALLVIVTIASVGLLGGATNSQFSSIAHMLP
jgi:Flp pilus assembly pilin Flp